MIQFKDIFCIEAVEPEVLELYRSTHAVSFPVENSPLLSAHAFVCLLKQEDGEKIFIAFNCREIRRSLIYAVGERPGMDALQSALGVAETMGFRMKAVNLKYSAAMREVILRDIPVLLSPRDARRLVQERAAEQAELTLIAGQAIAERADGAGEKRGGEPRAIAARIAAEKLAAEKRLDDQAAALRLEIEQLLAPENASEPTAQLEVEPPKMAEENTKNRTRELEEQLDNLQRVAAEAVAERKRLELAKAADEKELESLRRLLKKARAEIDAAAARQAMDETANGEHRARIGELEAGLRRAEAEILAQRTAIERLLEEKTTATAQTRDAAVRLAEIEMKLQDAEAHSDDDRAERDRLTAAKAANERLIDELRAALKKAEARMARHREEAEAAGAVDERMATLQEQLRQAEQRAEAERCEKIRLEEALAVSHMVIADLRSATPQAENPAREPGEGRVAELERALRQADERAEFLRLEVEHLAKATVAVTDQAAEKPAEGIESKPSALPSLSVARTEAAPSPRSLRRPPPPGAAFRVDWDLTAIPCSTVNDLCEAYQGIGMVQLCLEGYPNQYCSATILVLKKGEARQVYMPFRLSASKEALIYVPARQPETQADFTRTMREAVRFLQTVGIEVERIPLGRKGSRPNPALEPIVALLGPSKKAGNF